MKIRPIRAEFFHADRQTDTTMLIVTLRNFFKAPRITDLKHKIKSLGYSKLNLKQNKNNGHRYLNYVSVSGHT
jgi:hypothetical protein